MPFACQQLGLRYLIDASCNQRFGNPTALSDG
jgi:hypothetical protein